MKYPGNHWILALSVLAAPLGCDSGDGDDDGSTSTSPTSPMTSTTDDQPTDGGTDETGDDTGAEVTYAAVQAIWDSAEGGCVVGCHTAGGTGDSLSMLLLNAGSSHAELVGPMAFQLPSMPLVTPGDPNQSYLWHKLNGTQEQVGGSGLVMPQGKPQLSAASLDVVKAWIEAGAPM